MKMKKSTWLLLVLALAAIFLVAGCAPGTPPAPEPEPEPPTPTPPTDEACPIAIKTEVSKLYDATGRANFQIVITFDENVVSTCIQNPANWAIEVANAGRITSPLTAIPRSIAVSGKVVTVNAWVAEGYEIAWYEFVPLPAGFTGFATLGEAIAEADLIVEAIRSYGALANDQLTLLGVAPGVWSALLDTLEAAHDVQDGSLVANLNTLATDAANLADDANALVATAATLGTPISLPDAHALAADANALVARANNLVARANNLVARAAFVDPGRAAALYGRATWLANRATLLADETTAASDLFAALDPGDLITAAKRLANAADRLAGLATGFEGFGTAANLAANLRSSALTALNAELILFGYTAEEVTGTVEFAGLICNKDDAKKYANEFSVDAPTVADQVTWKLASGCVVSDEIGNYCCGYSDKACCEEPYCEPCEECVLEEVVCK